jgi:hypothetical protein
MMLDGAEECQLSGPIGELVPFRAVGHQNLDRAEGIQRGTPAFGPGNFPRPRSGARCVVSQYW